MPPARSGDLTASMALLGLMVRRPDTVAGVRERLAERFPHSGWSSSAAYSNLESLERQGLIRLVQQGEARGEDSYEATPRGKEHFQVWLREGSEAAPALHDATRARLVLGTEEDLPTLLPLLEAEQKVCTERFHAARWRLNKARHFGHLGPANGSEGKGRLAYALMVDDALIWGQRAMRLKRMRDELEGRSSDVEPRDLEDGYQDA